MRSMADPEPLRRGLLPGALGKGMFPYVRHIWVTDWSLWVAPPLTKGCCSAADWNLWVAPPLMKGCCSICP
jgi:hypothetical protein